MNGQGLCAVCRNARVIESDKGSRFLQCTLSKEDPSFAKYPRLPVLRCSGYVKSATLENSESRLG